MTLAELMNREAKGLAKDLRTTESALLEQLIRMRKKNVFPELGYRGVFSYCEGELKLSPAQSGYFQKVAEKSEEVPELKVAIDEGRISLSQARRIIPVLKPDNQEEWIEKASTLKQKELERAVTIVNPEAHQKERVRPLTPELSEIRFTVTVEEEREVRQMQNVLSKKLRRAVSLKEAFMVVGKDWLKKHDPIQRAERLSLRKAVTPKPQRPGQRYIRAATDHEVTLRDKRQCTFRNKKGKRCEETWWTERHHIKHVSQGGTNEARNITTLCSAHHRFLHRETE